MDNQDLIYRLRERARIRRQIPGRKSVQEGKSDRIADLLEEAANEIERLRAEEYGFNGGMGQ
jgi:surfactin synthase thioesterase subunit